MRHVKFTEVAKPIAAEPVSLAVLDSLARELAQVAATGDRRVRLLVAMQMLGAIRNLVFPSLSVEAERLINEAIAELMRCERDLPAEWRNR